MIRLLLAALGGWRRSSGSRDSVGMPTLSRDIDWDRFFDNAGRQN